MNNGSEVLNKITANWIQEHIKELYTMTKCDLFHESKVSLTFEKSFNIVH